MSKQIKDFENYYISEDGVVTNAKGKVMKLFKNPDGYMCLCLYQDSKRSHKRVCRLVAESYIPNPENKPVVNHKNSIRDDDRTANLEWATVKENVVHGVENNIDARRWAAVITKDQAHQICELLQDGLRFKDVAELLDVPKETISHISRGRTWKEISAQYNIPPKHSRVSIRTAEWVLTELSNGASYNDILHSSTNSRLTYNLIKLIDEGRVYRELIRTFNG